MSPLTCSFCPSLRSGEFNRESGRPPTFTGTSCRSTDRGRLGHPRAAKAHAFVPSAARLAYRRFVYHGCVRRGWQPTPSRVGTAGTAVAHHANALANTCGYGKSGRITPEYRLPSVCQGSPPPFLPSRILWKSLTTKTSTKSPVLSKQRKRWSRSASMSAPV
jgi:hypothetical protein